MYEIGPHTHTWLEGFTMADKGFSLTYRCMAKERRYNTLQPWSSSFFERLFKRKYTRLALFSRFDDINSIHTFYFCFCFLSLRVPAVVSINGGFYSALSPFNPRIIFYVCQQTDQTTHHRANLNRICICRTRFLIHFRTKRDNRRFKKIIMFNRKSKNYIHLPKYGWLPYWDIAIQPWQVFPSRLP